MHPDYRSDHPGNCPICGMPLEADRAGGASGTDAAVATQQLPTHLVVVRPGTGEIVAVSSNEAAAAGKDWMH